MELITAPLFSPIVGLRDYLLEIMQGYVYARTNQLFAREASMWNTFARIDNMVNQIDWLPPTVEVKWSVGKGNWARVPWIAFLDSRLTDTTQKGIYIAYLFREDMQGLYLALIQGVTDVVTQPGITQAEGRQLLRQRAESLRNNFGELKEHGFELDNNINLQAIAHLLLTINMVPSSTVTICKKTFNMTKLYQRIYTNYYRPIKIIFLLMNLQ